VAHSHERAWVSGAKTAACQPPETIGKAGLSSRTEHRTEYMSDGAGGKSPPRRDRRRRSARRPPKREKGWKKPGGRIKIAFNRICTCMLRRDIGP